MMPYPQCGVSRSVTIRLKTHATSRTQAPAAFSPKPQALGPKPEALDQPETAGPKP